MPREFLRDGFDLPWEEWLRRTFGSEADFFPVDMGEVVAGNLTPPQPEFLRRSDGHHLLYPGKIHWVSSEPEAGKSWFALLAVKELLQQGRKVVYFDYEMSPEDVARRLLLLGTHRNTIAELKYIRPPAKMSEEILRFYGTGDDDTPALFEGTALVVFDACTEAMVADGFDPLSNTDVAAWLQRAPYLAQRLGAAVLVLDHVVKDWEGRGRYAIGAQHKLAQTDVHYSLWNTQPFAPGSTGLSAITVYKDRPGGVRQHALDNKRAGTLVINADDPENVEGFIAEAAPDEGPTDRMAEILAFARGSVVPLSKSALESVGGGRGSTNRNAVARLIASGQLIPAPGDEGRRNPRWIAASAEDAPDGTS